MDMLNSIGVTISNIFSRASIWKRPDVTAALALGYGYDIEETDE